MSKPKIDRQISLPEQFIKELLTESELRMVKQRWFIIRLLEEGLPIRVIAEKAQVGTDTVVRMARKLQASPNLRKIFRKELISSKPSKWVFGQSNAEE